MSGHLVEQEPGGLRYVASCFIARSMPLRGRARVPPHLKEPRSASSMGTDPDTGWCERLSWVSAKKEAALKKERLESGVRGTGLQPSGSARA